MLDKTQRKTHYIMKQTKREEITSWIKWQINAGVFKKNEKLPSENQVAIKFGCSRLTARKAMLLLVEQGYIVVKSKIGYFVSFSKEKLTINPKNGENGIQKIQIIKGFDPTETQLKHFSSLGIKEAAFKKMRKRFIKTYYDEKDKPFVVIQSFVSDWVPKEFNKDELKNGFGAFLSRRGVKASKRSEVVYVSKIEQHIRVKLLCKSSDIIPIVYSKMEDEFGKLIEVAAQHFLPGAFEYKKETEY